jgi:hypothetical protein
VHLIDDVHLVGAILRRYPNSVAQLANIIHTAVRSGINLDNIKRTPKFLPIYIQIYTVNHSGNDPRHSGFTHPARTTKQVGVRNPTLLYCITQSAGNVLL